MSLQNRIRAVVAVILLLGAFVVFVPQGADEESQANAEKESVEAEKSPQIDWHDNSAGLSSAADDEIRPLFATDQSGGVSSVNSPEVSNQFRPLLPFRVLQPQKVDDEDLIPIEPRGYQDSDFIDDRDSIRHVIQPGETLQSISTRYYGHPKEYLNIYQFNKSVLRSPLDLPAGVSIRIPRN